MLNFKNCLLSSVSSGSSLLHSCDPLTSSKFCWSRGFSGFFRRFSGFSSFSGLLDRFLGFSGLLGFLSFSSFPGWFLCLSRFFSLLGDPSGFSGLSGFLGFSGLSGFSGLLGGPFLGFLGLLLLGFFGLFRLLSSSSFFGAWLWSFSLGLEKFLLGKLFGDDFFESHVFVSKNVRSKCC